MLIKINQQKAFTLIELAVVLFIIGLLTVGLLGPVATQVESRERQKTIETMEDIIEALYGFALLNGRLPCPDTTGDGLANPQNSADCTVATDEGWLPWQSLGLNVQGDVWGNRFRYHVTAPGFTTVDTGTCDDTDEELDLCEPGTLRVLTRGDNSITGAIESKFELTTVTEVPAVIVSHGKNGLGATTINNIALAAAAVGSDEAENTDADAVFYARGYSVGGTGCTDDTDETNILCEYDDIVMWLSPSILANRMVKAEVLP